MVHGGAAPYHREKSPASEDRTSHFLRQGSAAYRQCAYLISPACLLYQYLREYRGVKRNRVAPGHVFAYAIAKAEG